MPLQYAEIVLHAARTSIPNQIDRIERCDLAGHFVMLSQPHWYVVPSHFIRFIYELSAIVLHDYMCWNGNLIEKISALMIW